MVLAGLYYEAVESRFACALFQQSTEAFAWLARVDTAPVAREVSRLIEVAAGTPPVVRKLRHYLAGARGRVALHHAARAIGVGERSLQRHLSEAGTSFRAEGDRARIALAERLLLRDEAKIELVARQSDFYSASHLSRTLRRHTGETPAEFRRRRQRLG